MAESNRPYNQEAEQSVLGAALQNVHAALEVAETLNADDFFNRHNAEIYAVIAELALSGKPVDTLTVSDGLARRGTLELIGGESYLVELVRIVPTPSIIESYIDIVREYSTRRKLIEASEKIIEKCNSGEEEAGEVLNHAERTILDIGTGSQKENYSPIGEVLEENMTLIEERSKLPYGELTGLATGFTQLDNITNGFQPSDLIILAARPAMGKTSLALNIAMNAALKKQAVVIVFSLEMSKTSLGQRLLSTQSRIKSSLLQSGRVMRETDQTISLTEAKNELSNTKIYIDDNSGIQIGEIKNKCRRVKNREKRLDLIVIDYLQLMDVGGSAKVSSRPENRNQEIATLTRMLKQLAREMKCPVLVLSQLAREAARRKGGGPILSDLRDSGAIEQDADMVIFIHKKEPGPETSEDESEHTRELNIAKHRNGETGTITVRWISDITKFTNYDARVDWLDTKKIDINKTTPPESKIEEETDTEDDYVQEGFFSEDEE